ncbi:hypothetical protein [uncultured Campylobacter sp.]|uniref:hypothetical protein n=1 Tax=uncultured Campylobacter sp. TaxID=218934 RepID=UPI00260AC02A|nr:hypothetical protein [uncultured Campylobacter sp.]
MNDGRKKLWDSLSRSWVDAEDPFAAAIHISTGARFFPKPKTTSAVSYYRPKRSLKTSFAQPRSVKSSDFKKSNQITHFSSKNRKGSNQLIFCKKSIQHNQNQILKVAKYIAGLSNDKNENVDLVLTNPGLKNNLLYNDPINKTAIIEDFLASFDEESKRAQTMHLIFHAKAEGEDPKDATLALTRSWIACLQKFKADWGFDEECLIAQHPEQKKSLDGKRDYPHIHVLCRYMDLSPVKMLEIRKEMTNQMRKLGFELDDPKEKTHKIPDRQMEITNFIYRDDGKIDQIKLRSSNGIETSVKGVDLDRLCKKHNLKIGDRIRLKTTKEPPLKKGFKPKNIFELVEYAPFIEKHEEKSAIDAFYDQFIEDYTREKQEKDDEFERKKLEAEKAAAEKWQKLCEADNTDEKRSKQSSEATIASEPTQPTQNAPKQSQDDSDTYFIEYNGKKIKVTDMDGKTYKVIEKFGVKILGAEIKPTPPTPTQPTQSKDNQTQRIITPKKGFGRE